MRNVTLVAAVAFALVAASVATAQQAEPQDLAKLRQQVDAVEQRAPSVKKGDAQLGNQLLQQLAQLKQQLWRYGSKAHPSWAQTLKRIAPLERKVFEAATGQTPPTPAPDAHTQQATQALDAVEADLAGLKPGDVEGTNRLVHAINAARTTLAKSDANARGADAWIDATARADVLDGKVRARYAGQDGGADAAGYPQPGERPAAAPQKLSTDDDYKLRRDFYPVFDDYAQQLRTIQPMALADAHTFAKFEGAAARMSKALDQLSNQAHPHVAWAREKIAQFQASLAKRAAEGRTQAAERKAAAAAAAKDVAGRLDELATFFDPKTFTTKLEPPYTEERVKAWVASLEEWKGMGAKGLAELDRLAKDHPQYAQDPRVKNLRNWFSKTMLERVQRGIDETAYWYSPMANTRAPGGMESAMERAKRLLAPDMLTPQRLTQDTWVESSLASARTAIEAAEGKQVFLREYEGKADPALAQLVQQLRAFMGEVEAKAAQALANVRMPKKGVADDPELFALAKKVLAEAGYKPETIVRMVMNTPKRRYQEERSEARVDHNDRIVVRRWIDDWEDFQVACAQPEGGALRIVYYTIKFVHKSATLPTQRWYCAGQIVSTRILPENVHKD